MPKAIFRTITKAITSALLLCILITLSLSLYLNAKLPSVEMLMDIQLQVPLKIYSADKLLIAEFGEKRRSPIKIDAVPTLFIKAILAAEDDQFEQHYGVDPKSLVRAALQLITTGSIQTGGSTITMQVAKNYFLSREKTFSRKFNEILLALQIERTISKQEILELYINKIYLGNRAYGIEAAARVYYGKSISELNLAQLAMIAGLPKAPSNYNPIINPTRALTRRNWILKRMLQLEYITSLAYQSAMNQPVTASYHGQKSQLHAPYLAEMVRATLLKKYNAEIIYTTGMQVFTTINSDMQVNANSATQKGLLAYDKRHGYRGAEKNFVLDPENYINSAANYLKSIKAIGKLLPAIVVDITEQNITVLLHSNKQVLIKWDGLKWARPFQTTNLKGAYPKTAHEIVNIGDQIRIVKNTQTQWELSQVPRVQTSFAALNPNNGALLALVGGFNFQHSKYNRATQAKRQPGSNFKPFIYAAALENGYTAASLINDAPIVFDAPLLGKSWRPENYSGKFFGPTRLRKALYQSRNLVSIRLLRALTISKTISYVKKLGFDANKLPHDLSLALGSAEFTPLEILTGYAMIANGGYQVKSFFINTIKDYDGNIIFQETPWQVCEECSNKTKKYNTSLEAQLEQALLNELTLNETKDMLDQNTSTATLAQAGSTPKQKIIAAPRVMDERAAYILNSMLMDVIQRGTGRKAKSLGRTDLAGKTGTTNDQKDAWFSGYNKNLAATVWVGFDQPRTLGKYETGGKAALPIWIDFMRHTLKNIPEKQLPQPDGIVSIRIDPKTGLRAKPGQTDSIIEFFRTEFTPEKLSSTHNSQVFKNTYDTPPEQLF